MKAFIVDTAGTVTFFTIVAGLTELLIAGLEPSQVLVARLITIPVMILTGRPYGLWRDYVFSRSLPKARWSKMIADVFAFVTFQVPVYSATLAIAGATLQEIQAAVSAAIGFMIVLSRPFGFFLEVLRKWARTTTA